MVKSINIIIFILIILLLVFYFYNVNPGLIAANPKGSKSVVLNYLKDYCPRFVLVNKKELTNEQLKSILNTFEFPLVFKPDFCHDFANGVELVNNYNEAVDYITKSLDNKIIIQDYYHGPLEATIYYKKHPLIGKVDIVVTERIRKTKSNNDPWRWMSSLNAKEYNYDTQHHKHLQTPALKRKMEEITNKLPASFFGRYDIRFESHEKLAKAENFQVIEFNEIGSDTRLKESNSLIYNIIIFWTIIFTRFEFGFLNSLNPKYTSVSNSLRKCYITLFKIHKCNHNKYFIKSLNKFHKIVNKIKSTTNETPIPSTVAIKNKE